MSNELRALALVATALVPTTVLARPATDSSAEALLARHRLPPGDAAATGRALLAIGDIPRALAAFRQAVAEAPQSATARNGLAACYERLGRDDLARQAYEQALAIAPESAVVQVNLAGLLVRIGAAEAAIPLLQHAAASGEADVAAAARRLQILAGVALRNRAIAAQQTAVIAAPAAPARDVELAGGVTLVSTAPARIVAAADGEVRLVTAAPPPELVARLGDDAALAEPARPWLAEEEAAVRVAGVDTIAPAANRRLPPAAGAPTPGPLAATTRVRSASVSPSARWASPARPMMAAIVAAQPDRRRPGLTLVAAVARTPAPTRPLSLIPLAADAIVRPDRPGLVPPRTYALTLAAAPRPPIGSLLRAMPTSLPERRWAAPVGLAAVVRAWHSFAGDRPRPSTVTGLAGFDRLLRQGLA